MDPREQRGLEIAARFKVVRTDRGWSVPSQSGAGKYTVAGVDADAPRCTCPDFETRGEPCKHIFAVRLVIQRELFDDGETITERVTVTKTVKRATYRQDWPSYNRAQTNEKDRFMALLRDLCAGIAEPEQKRGRPRLPLRDAHGAAGAETRVDLEHRREHEILDALLDALDPFDRLSIDDVPVEDPHRGSFPTG